MSPSRSDPGRGEAERGDAGRGGASRGDAGRGDGDANHGDRSRRDVGALHPVAILAGGMATRLRPITEAIPKSLVDVHGRPFIAWQLDWLRDQGADRVVVCAGYRGEQIQEFVGDGRAWGLRVEWLFDGPVLLGTAGALKRAVPLLSGPFFVLYGDSYLPIAWRPVQEAFDASGKLALMTVFRNEGQFDRSNVEFADGRILVYDKRAVTPRMRHIDYGLGLFMPEAFDGVPDGEPADLAGLYGELLARGELAAYEVHERFYEIGSFEGLEATSAYLAARQSVANERVPNERVPNERVPNERAPNERALNDRVPNERAPNERALNERALNDRAPNDRVPNERVPNR